MSQGQLYLACQYAKGAFPSEYAISFLSKEGHPGSCFVEREDVIPIDSEKGLVRLMSAVPEKGESNYVLVGIRDHAEQRISRFYVPSSEILHAKS